jgi:hypothetical protein
MSADTGHGGTRWLLISGVLALLAGGIIAGFAQYVTVSAFGQPIVLIEITVGTAIGFLVFLGGLGYLAGDELWEVLEP